MSGDILYIECAKWYEVNESQFPSSFIRSNPTSLNFNYRTYLESAGLSPFFIERLPR